MPKILTDKDMADIIWRAVHDGDIIECSESYIHFIEGLGDLISRHFGGRREGIGVDIKSDRFTAVFRIDECVPSDGGVFNEYDIGVTWKNGVETCR